MNQTSTLSTPQSGPRSTPQNFQSGPKTDYEPGSMCFCRQCDTCVPHQKGRPCEDIRCPRCGAPMTRKF